MFNSSDQRSLISWTDSGVFAGSVVFTSFDWPIYLFLPEPVGVTLRGTSGDDLLEGSAEDDLLYGRDGNDTIFGLNGRDTLIGGKGDDYLHAGEEGAEGGLVLYDQRSINRHNLLKGGAGNDTLIGSGVRDTLLGGEGNDWIETGRSTSDEARGGLGDDTILGDGTLRGEAGDDRLEASGTATLKGGSGEDTLVGANGAKLSGGLGADTFVFGADGLTEILDLGSDDRLVIKGRHIDEADLSFFLGSGPQSDPTELWVAARDGHARTGFKVADGFGQTLFRVTYEGADTVLIPYERGLVSGSQVSETLQGSDASEVIQGGGGADTLTGGNGYDLFVVDLNRNADRITDFTFDEDRIDLRSWGATDMTDIQISYLTPDSAMIRSATGHMLWVDALEDQYTLSFVARDFLFAEDSGDVDGGLWQSTGVAADAWTGGTSSDLIDGGQSDDNLSGDAGNDRLFGGDGDDTLRGNSGDDLIWGDRGNDVIYGGAGDDTALGLMGDDQLFGGSGADVLDGGVGNDLLRGGGGDDLVIGGLGQDTIEGGAGTDTLRGGSGADTFRLIASPDQGHDLVEDFEAGIDQIVVHLRGYDAADVSVTFDASDGGQSLIEIAGLDVSMSVDTVQLTFDDLFFV